MWVRTIYYQLKPYLPLRLQIQLRKILLNIKRKFCSDIWPIDESAGTTPVGWKGWPGGKKFAFVLTHDVETQKGHDRCYDLIRLERKHGFLSSFNFVPERYAVSSELRSYLEDNGYEVGVHGLKHDGKLYASRQIFMERSVRINHYLQEWGAVGFRSPAMHHNLEWIQELNILYDASTFDTDPFEPQPDGMKTIFPFIVKHPAGSRAYVELPYTLPQDSTLFVYMQEKTINTWIQKLDWIAQHGGMALVIVHPDYMNFNEEAQALAEYPARMYEQFLQHVRTKYEDQFWHVLPKDLAKFWQAMSDER